MAQTFVDTNVVLDLVTDDAVWRPWSQRALETTGQLIANALVYAELCTNAESPDEVDALFSALGIALVEIPRQALFVAAKAHLEYRERGGTRQTGLPDFFIGAHAAVLGVPILTRDPQRFRTYFPSVALITPEKDTR